MPARPRLLPAAAAISAMLLAVLLAVNVASYRHMLMYDATWRQGGVLVAAASGVGGVSLTWRNRGGPTHRASGFSALPNDGQPSASLLVRFRYEATHRPTGQARRVMFPLWAPMLPLAVPPALWWRRRRRATRPGFPVGLV